MDRIDEPTGLCLVRLARSAIAARISGGEDSVALEGFDPALGRRGVFVTLRKFGKLRGCIGTFFPSRDLPGTVVEMSVAATRDPRFTATPIGAAELNDIRIELSVLSPLTRITDPLSFERGRHGVYLRHGAASGCFLPDVGMDLGWDKEQFLSELCKQKAGLSARAWEDEQAEIHIFTVQKIVEA
ncbi:MAG: AmmeMemoRadiSam system protein A [Phycisphaerae bacterium]